MKTQQFIKAAFLCVCAVSATAFAGATDKQAKDAEAVFLKSFRPENPSYWMRRLEQDKTMKLCSQYKDNPPPKVRQKIELEQKATIRYPVDGKLVGDWKEGEKLAAVGTGGHIGFIQPDPYGRLRGGNCYACHQLAKAEVAYGTIGPSLQRFAKTRGQNGVVDEATVKYVYDKIYNSNAFTACTNMPRFGYHAWLTPEQITHLVAYLVDPNSPVNKD
ncbi:MAG TPA: sulfur oxidation c-type cytochrome SoxX [Rhodocyclaceae bacterium]|nr:sulfur oxidation c-type cytochrome SoxX [Rhodocyclaceae bacterium]